MFGLLDMIHSGTKNNKDYNHFLIAVDDFSKNNWSLLLRKKTAQKNSKEFSIFFRKSNRKPNLKDLDDGKEFSRKNFTYLPINKDIEK